MNDCTNFGTCNKTSHVVAKVINQTCCCQYTLFEKTPLLQWFDEHYVQWLFWKHIFGQLESFYNPSNHFLNTLLIFFNSGLYQKNIIVKYFKKKCLATAKNFGANFPRWTWGNWVEGILVVHNLRTIWAQAEKCAPGVLHTQKVRPKCYKI